MTANLVSYHCFVAVVRATAATPTLTSAFQKMICLSEETDTMTEPSGEYLVGEHALATPRCLHSMRAASGLCVVPAAHLTQLV